MNCYRISKYNPEFRDESGRYTREEWTSISDIGKVFSGEKLTKEKYIQAEESYINAVKMVLSQNKVDELMIAGLERYYDDTDIYDLSYDEQKLLTQIKDNMSVRWDTVELIIKMALRENLWCVLKSEKVEIQFGYDYYMYIKCDNIQPTIIQKLFDNNVFVELNK